MINAFTGTAIKYDGNNINTDEIMSNEFLAKYGLDAEKLAEFCFAHYDPSFAKRVKPGDVLIAGENFGCGSSKPAGIALKAAGIKLVIAKSFSRLFYRTSLNNGLFLIESPEIAESIKDGDELTVDPGIMKIFNRSQNSEYRIPSYPEFVWEIISSNGIVNWFKKGGTPFE